MTPSQTLLLNITTLVVGVLLFLCGLCGFRRACRVVGWVVVLAVAFVLSLPRMVLDTADELRDVANWIIRWYRMKK